MKPTKQRQTDFKQRTSSFIQRYCWPQNEDVKPRKVMKSKKRVLFQDEDEDEDENDDPSFFIKRHSCLSCFISFPDSMSSFPSSERLMREDCNEWNRILRESWLLIKQSKKMINWKKSENKKRGEDDGRWSVPELISVSIFSPSTSVINQSLSLSLSLSFVTKICLCLFDGQSSEQEKHVTRLISSYFQAKETYLFMRE